MLVLTRKLQEQIAIGQDITITVLRLKGNTVKIGIEAPDNVRVVRGELPRITTPRTATSNSAQSEQCASAPRASSHKAINPKPLSRPIPKRAALDMPTRATGLSSVVERVNHRRRAVSPVLLAAVAATDTVVTDTVLPGTVLLAGTVTAEAVSMD